MRASRIWQLVGVVWSVIAGAWFAFGPLYGSSSDTDESGSQSGLEANGSGVLLILAIPLLISALPLVSSGRLYRVMSLVAASLLGAFMVLALFSIGIFYLPAVAALVLAAVLAWNAPTVP